MVFESSSIQIKFFVHEKYNNKIIEFHLINCTEIAQIFFTVGINHFVSYDVGSYFVTYNIPMLSWAIVILT